MYRRRDVRSPRPEQFRKERRRDASIPHVTGIGRRQYIHLSPTIAVYRLRMCVATAFRLTKNEYDSHAERAFDECAQSVSRRDELNWPWLVRNANNE